MTKRGALFVADWIDVAFVHFRVDESKLRRMVPLEIDRFDGDAYVSVVAFTQHRLRPCAGGRLAEWLSAPLASHEFLNVRTYVLHDGASGIFFMTEWIPNRLAALIGPGTYGLPYRLGRMRYDGPCRRVEAAGAGLEMSLHADDRCSIAGEGSLDHFLLERYAAFTCRRGVTRRFDVAHAPWPQALARVMLEKASLLPTSGDWIDGAELVRAHVSPGVTDVIISPPRRVSDQRFASAARHQ